MSNNEHVILSGPACLSTAPSTARAACAVARAVGRCSMVITTPSAMRKGFALLLVGTSLMGRADAALPATCQEDAPCFNWRTMGNHERGLTTLAGRFKVVDARHFDALNRAFRIDWTRTARLRGDGHRYDVQDY